MQGRPIAPRSVALIYDGACGRCRGAVAWIRVRDSEKCFEFVPYQSAELDQRFPQVSREAYARAMHLVFPDGRVFAGADALPPILDRLPGWRVAGHVLGRRGLRPLNRALYRWIARTRNRDAAAECEWIR
jgi:predicted DCC family thiol-disulfide oxidoreductase YuxK